VRALRDVYKKYINSAGIANGMFEDREMAFFYIRNNNFIALFSFNEKGEPIAVLNPSKNLMTTIKESNHYTISQYHMNRGSY
jgi:hypothetical protein